MDYKALKQKHDDELNKFYAMREARHLELWHSEKDIIEALDMEQSRIPDSLRQRLIKTGKSLKTNGA